VKVTAPVEQATSATWADVTFSLKSSDAGVIVFIDDFAIGTKGCTNTQALNYDRNAVVEDDSCVTEPCCNLAYAVNYIAGECNANLHDVQECKFEDISEDLKALNSDVNGLTEVHTHLGQTLDAIMKFLDVTDPSNGYLK
jgi:hypothetical protein